MKQSRIIEAYRVLSKLSEKELPLPISYKLFKLKKTLSPAWEFQTQEETRILEKYKPESVNGTSFKFKNADEANKFKEELRTLSEMESDIEIFTVSLPELPDLILSAKDLDALDGFVTFPELEEKSDGEI